MNVEIVRRKRAERHRMIDAIKDHPCADCGKQYPPYVMDFDHRDPRAKEHEINHLVNKTTASWEYILTEIKKCDIVCACCHRLRSWMPSKTPSGQRRLVAALKGDRCADCAGVFHRFQLDFDHVRGEKIGFVPHMGTAAAIRAEAAKCDVVCANCHRVRSHESTKGARRNDPATIDMIWKRAGAGLRTLMAPRDEVVPYQLKVDLPAPRPWHRLAGKQVDTEVARIGGVSRSMVCLYRKRLGIPSYKSQLKVS